MRAIVLAAGKGTRMKSSLPKVLHTLGGQPLLHHVLDVLEDLKCIDICLVLSPEMKEDLKSFHEGNIAIQHPALGTGHAVQSAKDWIQKSSEDVLVLFGDTPLITSETLRKMKEAKDPTVSLVVLAMRPQNPGAYGRVLLEGNSSVVNSIVEFKDASDEIRQETLCNSGVMLIDGKYILSLLEKLDNKNAQQEFYLTDLVQIARYQGLKTVMVEGSEEELLGVNSRNDLAKAEHVFQERRRHMAMSNGATLLDPHTVYFSFDTKIGQDVVIEPHVYFGPGVTIENNVKIYGFSHMEGAHLEEGCSIGPFARLRPGTRISQKAKVGNFVEIKKSILEKGSKVNHLSYIGDAIIGARANIGAGTITCNYDGYQKHPTAIGEGAFIGSNSCLVAPIHIGKYALVGAGSVITEDIEDYDLSVARSAQKNFKEGSLRFQHKKNPLQEDNR
jgi:bifunctional UDP-N-acetylglucosamine pyrophosphorylase/glucosamine-1-phosphate N-acetyltransferase